jgi:alpha-ketoglutarate-dependent taurine dioxygenase
MRAGHTMRHDADPDRQTATEALDALHRDRRFVLEMDFRTGDMQFLNNGVMLHRRTAYQDHPEPELRRDLIRLWLNRRPGVTG